LIELFGTARKMTPALCGTFLTDKRSLVAFTWTITTVLTLAAFIVSGVMMAHTHTHYKRLERYYEYQMNNNDDSNDDKDNGNDSSDRQYQEYLLLATLGSKSLTFAAVYTMILAIGLCLYGSTAIVGFTSLRGVYIAPCFSSEGSPKLKLGVFGGAIIFFANLLLVCAVIFGEVRVSRLLLIGVLDGVCRQTDYRGRSTYFFRKYRLLTQPVYSCVMATGGRLERRESRRRRNGTLRSGADSDNTSSRLHVLGGLVHYLCRTFILVLWERITRVGLRRRSCSSQATDRDQRRFSTREIYHDAGSLTIEKKKNYTTTIQRKTFFNHIIDLYVLLYSYSMFKDFSRVD
jgi:hypothetical protein